MSWEVRFENLAAGENAYVDAVQLERGDFVTPYGLPAGEAPSQQRSGVSTVELLIDDVVRGSDSGGCTDATCALRASALSYSISDQTLADGVHSVRVRATDKAGNVTLGRPWDIVLDRSAPQIVSTSGELTQGRSFGPGVHKVLVEATDFGQPGAAPGTFGSSSSFERGTPYWFYTWQSTGSVASGPLTTTNGSKYFQVTSSASNSVVAIRTRTLASSLATSWPSRPTCGPARPDAPRR